MFLVFEVFYRLKTANDSPERDPSEWTVSVTINGHTKTKSETDVTTTEDRGAFYPDYYFLPVVFGN